MRDYYRMEHNRKQEEKRKPATINCGCGCFGCLTAVVSFILLCYVLNCEWAKRIVHRCITDVTAAIHKGEK